MIKVNFVIFSVLIFASVGTAHGQTSIDLEELDLQAEASFISNEDKEICDISEYKDLRLPVKVKVNYPSNLNVQIFATSADPENSKMRKLQNENFYTLSIENSTDTFTIKTQWSYDTNPNTGRQISYEIFSKNSLYEVGKDVINDFEYCNIFTITTQQPEHIPTLEEFKAENLLQINEIVEVLARAFVDNNDLIFILIIGIVCGIAIVIALIFVVLYSNKQSNKRSNEITDRLVSANTETKNLHAGLRVLARNNVQEAEKIGDSIIRQNAYGFNDLRNLFSDFRTILNLLLGELPRNIPVPELESKTLKSARDIELLKTHLENEKTSIKDQITAKFSKTKKTEDEINTENMIKKYVKIFSDHKKYPITKLNEMDKKFRAEYKKKGSYDLYYQIEAIVIVVRNRMGVK